MICPECKNIMQDYGNHITGAAKGLVHCFKCNTCNTYRSPSIVNKCLKLTSKGIYEWVQEVI